MSTPTTINTTPRFFDYVKFMRILHACQDGEMSCAYALNKFEDEVAPVVARAAMAEELVGVIEAHEIESLSCDRDGETYCDCLRKAVVKYRALARATDGEQPKDL